MLLQEFLRVVEHEAALGGLADGFDLGGADGVGLVAEIVPDKGKNTGDFLVLQHAAEGRHRDLAVVFFAVDFYEVLTVTHDASFGPLKNSFVYL